MTEWESREVLEAAVVDYQSSWWRHDADALAVIADVATHPGLRGQILATSALGQIVTTAAVYRPTHPGAPDDRPYLPARDHIHERIIADCVPFNADAGSERPAAYFTIGCPGAGKTSVLREIVQQHRRAAPDQRLAPLSVIDADRVRQLLPEYADGLGAFVVEEECYYLTYGDVFDRAVARRADMVYDTIGRLSSIRENLDLLRAEGYAIHMLHADSALDLCQERTARRALVLDGRLVHPSMLRRAADDAEQAIGALIGEGVTLTGWAKIDTTDMSAPTLTEGTFPWSELF